MYLSMNCSHCSTQLPKVQLFSSSLQNIYTQSDSLQTPALHSHQRVQHIFEVNVHWSCAAPERTDQNKRINARTEAIAVPTPRILDDLCVVPQLLSGLVRSWFTSMPCTHHVSRLPVCCALRSRIPQLYLFHELTRAIPSITGLIHNLEY